MQPDEPDREEELEQLPEDNETPFRPATSPRSDVADESEEREAEGVVLDDTHPITDTNIQPEELYDEGVSGAATILIAPAKREIISANHFDQSNSYPVDITFDKDDVRAEDFDAVFLPGGALNADFLRTNPQAQKFVQDIDKAGKPLAVICHGPWLLVSAGLVKGRHLTSFYTIADDIRNAGGKWSDKAIVRDDNWVSSRQPDDIPEFNKAVIDLFTTGAHARKLQPVL